MNDFKITGPGEYRTRDGRKAVVKRNNKGGSYCWQGKIGEEYYDWTEYGSYWNKGIISINDIIGPWEEPATVSSVLTYAGVTKKPSDVLTLTWLDFVTIMNDPASVRSSSPKAEKQSEDEAHGNTACAEAGSAFDQTDAIVEVVGMSLPNLGLEQNYKTEAEKMIGKLRHHGFVIVRLKDTRNGCYNTRTEKDVD